MIGMGLARWHRSSMRQAYYSTSAIRCRLFPDHPHPLYYIALDHNSFALSHLEPSESSKELQPETIIGWITTKDSSFESPVLPGPSPLNFKPNPSYETLIHRILKKYVNEDPVLEALAKHQGLGYFNVNDQRTATNYGRVSDPEDILGTVRLSDGQMVPGTYEKMPTHRLVSGSGLFILSDFIHSKLMDHLKSL